MWPDRAVIGAIGDYGAAVRAFVDAQPGVERQPRTHENTVRPERSSVRDRALLQGLRLANALAKRDGEEVRILGLCGTCMDARAIGAEGLLGGAHRSTLEELADWTLWADKVVTF